MYIKIGNSKIGENHPTFIVAELSANHEQKYGLAVKTIKAIKEAGADAVKLTTDRPDRITINCTNKYFRIKQETLWDGKNLYQLYRENDTPWEWQPKLKRIAEDLGLIFFSTATDPTSADFLEGINVPAYKIASFEITDIPLINHIAKKNKPIIISTGIATLADIEEAINTCKKMGNKQIALLKCTSTYPTLIQESNLLTIPNMINTFKTVVGLSDHTPGIIAPIVAVSLGAKIVEKHFILNRGMNTPDAPFSLEPREFKEMVKSIRQAELALGEINYGLSNRIRKSRQLAKSLFITENIKTGEVINCNNVRPIRPGFGLHPRYLQKVLGKKARRNLKKGTPLDWDLIQ